MADFVTCQTCNNDFLTSNRDQVECGNCAVYYPSTYVEVTGPNGLVSSQAFHSNSPAREFAKRLIALIRKDELDRMITVTFEGSNERIIWTPSFGWE